MPTDKTPEPQVHGAQAHELDEGQLDQAAGGLLPAVQIAVDPSDPSGATYNPSRGVFYLRNSMS